MSIFNKNIKQYKFDIEDIKNDLKNYNFPASRNYINSTVSIVFPLYAPKITFFKITGKLKKNFKSKGLNQTLYIASVVSKNQVTFKVSPHTPFIYVF